MYAENKILLFYYVVLQSILIKYLELLEPVARPWFDIKIMGKIFHTGPPGALKPRDALKVTVEFNTYFEGAR